MKSLFKRKEKPIPKIITYDYFKQREGIRKYYLKNYSYYKISPKQQRNRLYFFGVGFTLAILCFLGFLNNHDLTMKVTFFIATTFFMINAISVLTIGFIRNTITFIISISLIILDTTLYQNYLLNNSRIIILIFIIILNILIGATLIYLINKDFISRKVTILSYFYNDDNFLGIDLAIHAYQPIYEYNHLIKITIDISKDYNANSLNAFDWEFINFCEKNKFIFLAHQAFSKEQIYELFISLKDSTISLNKITKYLTNHLKYSHKIEYLKNINVWQYYTNNLYPDDYAFLKENTKNFVQRLENDNFDFNQEYPLCFLLQFANSNDALKCKKNYKKYGYEKAIDFTEDNHNYHMVAVELTTKLGLQRSLKITKEAYEYAKAFHGLMIEWRIGNLNIK